MKGLIKSSIGLINADADTDVNTDIDTCTVTNLLFFPPILFFSCSASPSLRCRGGTRTKDVQVCQCSPFTVKLPGTCSAGSTIRSYCAPLRCHFTTFIGKRWLPRGWFICTIRRPQPEILVIFGSFFHCAPLRYQFTTCLWMSGLNLDLLIFRNVFGQACQPKWCYPVYSNTDGPDAMYYEETTCTSEVVDFTATEFPGKLKLPGGSYMADIYYTADGLSAGGVAGGGTGLCMPKDIEVVDLKLHLACMPQQVCAPFYLCIHRRPPTLSGRAVAEASTKTSARHLNCSIIRQILAQKRENFELI